MAAKGAFANDPSVFITYPGGANGSIQTNNAGRFGGINKTGDPTDFLNGTGAFSKASGGGLIVPSTFPWVLRWSEEISTVSVTGQKYGMTLFESTGQVNSGFGPQVNRSFLWARTDYDGFANGDFEIIASSEVPSLGNNKDPNVKGVLTQWSISPGFWFVASRVGSDFVDSLAFDTTGLSLEGDASKGTVIPIKFYDGSQSNYAAIRSTPTLTGTYTLTLPQALPSSGGMALVSDTQGNLTFSAVASAISFSSVAVIHQNGKMDVYSSTGGDTANGRLAVMISTSNLIACGETLVLGATSYNIQGSSIDTTLNGRCDSSAGFNIIGQGTALTQIHSTRADIIVQQGTNNVLHDFSIYGDLYNGNFQAPIGSRKTETGWLNYNIFIKNEWDGWWFFNGSAPTIQGTIINGQTDTGFDSINLSAGSASLIDIYQSRFKQTADSTQQNFARGIIAGGGTVNLRNVDIVSTNPFGNYASCAEGSSSLVASAAINWYSGVCSRSGGSGYDLKATSPFGTNNITISVNAGVKFDPTQTFASNGGGGGLGKIIFLDTAQLTASLNLSTMTLAGLTTKWLTATSSVTAPLVNSNSLNGTVMTVNPTTSLTINLPTNVPMVLSNTVASGSLWPEIRAVNQSDYLSGFALDRSGGSGIGAPGGEWMYYRYGSAHSDKFCIGQNGISEPFCISAGSAGGLLVGTGVTGTDIPSGLRVAGEAVFGDGTVSPTAVLDTYPNGIVFGTGVISDDSNGNITGSGTLFTSEVQIGDVLFDTADSEYATVINIINNTSLTVFPSFPDASGASFQILPPTFAAHKSDLGLGGGEPAQIKTWQNGFTGIGTLTPVNGYNSKIAFELFGNGGAMVRFGANSPGSGKIRIFQFTNNGDSAENFDQSIDSSGNPSFDLPNGKQFCFDSTPNSISHVHCIANNGQLSSAANTAGRVVYTVAGGLSGPDFKDSANLRFDGTTLFVTTESATNITVATVSASAIFVSSTAVFSSTSPQTIAVSTNNVNNWNVGAAPVVYASFTVAGSSATGIVAGIKDETRTLINVSTVTINLPHESLISIAANRFLNAGSTTVSLAPNEWAILRYDQTQTRWRVRKL